MYRWRSTPTNNSIDRSSASEDSNLRFDAGTEVRLNAIVLSAKNFFSRHSRWLKYFCTAVFSVIYGFVLFNISPPMLLAATVWLLLPVIVSAYFGGFGPGLFAAAVSILASEIFARIPIHANAPPAERWAVYSLVAVLISLLTEFLHRARKRAEASELLRSVTLSSLGEAVVTTDRQGRITFLNAVAERLSGWDQASALGQGFSTIFPINAADTDRCIPDLSLETLRTGDTARMFNGHYLKTRKGLAVPIEASAAPIRLADGTPHGVVLTLRDCSERQRIEDAMHERIALQERLSAIAQMLPGALHTLRIYPDRSSKLTYASSSFQEVYGLDPVPLAINAQPMLECVHPDDWPWIVERVVRGMELSLPLRLEYRVQHRVKGLIWVELHAVPTRETDGGTSWHGAIFDITARKRIEDQLRASQVQLRAALEAGEMGVLQIDLESGAVVLDDTAGRLWGISPSQLGKEPLVTLINAVHPEDRPSVEREYRAAVLHADGFQSEFRVQQADGSVGWLSFHARVERTADGKASQVISLINDVSFRRQTEELRLRSQKLEALGVLAGGIAHDFNNLLLVITGNIKLLKADLPADHPTQVSLDEVAKAGARATTLVRQILTFSQPQDQRREMLQLRPVLEEILGLARSILPTTIAMHTKFAEDMPAVMADAGQVHQAVLNLLTNAADAAPSVGGSVTVRLEEAVVDETMLTLSTDLRPGAYVRVVVSDNGHGIDEATLQRIFDPFFTTKPTGQGTGLGLAIVHGIMKANGGAVVVDSKPGAGSSFTLYFPAVSGKALPAAAEPARENGLRGARILYVDDEEPLVFLMTRTLQRAHHHVEGFSDPHAALEAFRERPQDFDLIVSDMAMPGMSGFDLACELMKIRAEVPIVITSGYLRPEDYERAREIGIRELILKPNTVDELGGAVNRLLS